MPHEIGRHFNITAVLNKLPVAKSQNIILIYYLSHEFINFCQTFKFACAVAFALKQDRDTVLTWKEQG